MYGYTQLLDARGASASLDDAGVRVGETLVLDLEARLERTCARTEFYCLSSPRRMTAACDARALGLEALGAVLTVHGLVDIAARGEESAALDGTTTAATPTLALNVSVRFVPRGSGYHEAALGVDGVLDACGGADAGDDDAAATAARTLSLALRVDDGAADDDEDGGAADDASDTAASGGDDGDDWSDDGCWQLTLSFGVSGVDGTYARRAVADGDDASTSGGGYSAADAGDVDFYYERVSSGDVWYLYRLYSQYVVRARAYPFSCLSAQPT